MTPKPTAETLSTEVLALRAAVRALARVQGRRSGAALAELVQAMAEETGRLREDLPSYDLTGRQAADRAGGYLAQLISELTEEAEAA
jgi:hypothetical protein